MHYAYAVPRQLRPKVNNYRLTVEKGEQYDLDRSLFERLINNRYPHSTLQKQHRMRPEISALVRHLTYPDLVDDVKTQGRDNIRGLRDNVIFIHHEKPEDDHAELNHAEFVNNETTMKSSKRNKYEVDMVLKILRYLGQQGYRTEEIVILTPYLGQLRALQEALKCDNDPILNDLDSADLVRAGLVTSAAAKLAKRPIRLATIGEYYCTS
jgi:superfamily I DNA and/or RNA helicase